MLSGLKEDKPLPSMSALVGEYTNWVFVWSYSCAPHGIDNLLLKVDNIGNVYVAEQPNAPGLVMITRLGVGTFRVNDILINNWWYGANSVDNKFVLGINNAIATMFRVYRYGAFIFQRNVPLDYGTFTSFDSLVMSPNGKYIAISGFDTVTLDDDIVILYEGI